MKIRKSSFKDLLTNRFSFYTFVGWESEQDHYNLMKSDEYQVFKDVFADYVDKESGVKIYHTELNKVYGDF